MAESAQGRDAAGAPQQPDAVHVARVPAIEEPLLLGSSPPQIPRRGGGGGGGLEANGAAGGLAPGFCCLSQLPRVPKRFQPLELLVDGWEIGELRLLCGKGWWAWM